jgi:hypothetical protein
MPGSEESNERSGTTGEFAEIAIAGMQKFID